MNEHKKEHRPVAVVVDSTCDTSAPLRPRLRTVPLTVNFDGEEFLDGVTITTRQFYEKLIESDALPTTSQPSPAAFAAVFREEIAAGRDVLVVTVSSQLSGTHQSAVLAAEEFPGRVFVVDSTNAAIGAGVLAELALRLVDEGLGAAGIAARLEREREDIRLIALLDTLEYLHKGGRLSRTAALAGGMLSIKPVVHLKDGAIELLGKARGSRRANNLLLREIEAAGGVDFDRPLLLGYTGLSDLLLQKYIEDSAPLWQDHRGALPVTGIGSAIGTHAGPGAIAVAFFRRGRG
ncbi:MAG: DegV family protein [Clostridia bacterium]|nr:DegV family protein [Clostridia bacterium]